ncbi:MAG TPA: P-loop NTPase fold protein, partial [candidate division Zixibacteria bacterium]|nr:P-loop NTPase fold protein [candidate division Zixibacteria bacterium]
MAGSHLKGGPPSPRREIRLLTEFEGKQAGRQGTSGRLIRMNQLISKTFSTTSIIVLLRVILLGASVCELYFFVNALFLKVWTLLLIGNAAIIIFAFASIGIILGVWILIRRLLIGAFRILKATRIDVVLSFTLGILISASIGGFGSEYYRNLIWSMQPYTILAILMISFLFFLSFGIRYIKLKLELLKTVHDAFFVFDSEQISKKNDLLGFSDKAEKFGERVMNRGSKNSMVYGIDAPWGIGKSSFVNLCIEYWEETYTHQVVVFKFSPLMYESTSDLLEKFVDGIITAIQKTAYIPEIRPLVQKYTRLIKAKATLSFFGLEMTPWRQPIDEILKDLEVVLLGLNKKVIVVVDDLDRLNFSEVKDILYAVKKSFTLPNISYVLCYDTENISALEKDKPHFDKVTDFLEKFVNVKVSIFLDSKALQDYVSKNLVIALSGNSQADHGLVSIAIGGLIEIYQSQEFNQYLPYIGDVRKLKRLINTLLLLEIEKSDFDNTDFNKSDLINLLLIYINYPNVFRKIYNAETLGKRGFFSAVVPRDPGYPEENSTKGPPAGQPATFETSIYYREFLKTLTPNQIFLLNKVFDVKARLVSPAIDSVPEVVKTSYACFNGAWSGKNLEQYLNLIVNQSKPQKETQHKYYLNLKNQIIGGKPFEEVFAVEQLSFEDGEINLEKLWNIIIGSLDEFKGETGGQLINYLVQNIRRYSLIEIENISIGLRKRLGFFLVKILNKIGWSDEFGMHANNSEENIAEIAEWIFGERRHTKQGLLYSLSKEEKGI